MERDVDDDDDDDDVDDSINKLIYVCMVGNIFSGLWAFRAAVLISFCFVV